MATIKIGDTVIIGGTADPHYRGKRGKVLALKANKVTVQGIGSTHCLDFSPSNLTIEPDPTTLDLLMAARKDHAAGKRDGATMGRLSIALDAAIAALGGEA